MKAIMAAPQASDPLLATPPFGFSFCTTAVELAPGEVQLALPQLQELGQQLPPTEASQVAQPEAQFPVGVVTVAAGPTGTTIVFPLLTIVVESVAGLQPRWLISIAFIIT
jgi:hypothetical protein